MWCGVWTSLGILSVQPSVSTPARRPVLPSWRSEVEGNRCLRPEEGEEPFLLFFPRRLPTTQAQPASKLQGIDRLDRGGRSIDRYSFSFKNVRKKPPSAMPSFGEGVRDKCCREREISWYKLEPRASEPGEKEGKDHRQH